MKSEYIGLNKNGELKRFIRTVVQTCPTLECKTFNLEKNTLETKYDNKKENNEKAVESKSSSSSDTTYIEDAISELAKKRIINIGKHNSEDMNDLQDIHALADTIMKLKSKLDSSQIEDTLDKMRTEVASSIQQALSNKNKDNNNFDNQNQNNDQLSSESDISKKKKIEL